MSDGAGVMLGAPAVVGEFLKTFKDYPPTSAPRVSASTR